MAGKQKNIKIVYQVDTTQVKAAEATVGRAKTATDQLKKSTKELGDQTKAAGTQYKLTTSDMIGELNLLKQKILDTATTDKNRLNELIPKYRELKAQVDALNKSMDGTAKSSASVGVSLGGIYNSVRLALTAGLIRETARAVIEMTALAGKVDGVKRAFDKLPNSVALMGELKQRTHGALTELELMQKALQARNFGIPIENLGKLLEFAAIKSQQTGISIQYLTDSIVTGLGRESIKILDNLQIDIGKLKQRMQETGQSMRIVVGEIVNEELKKMGGYLETGETKVNKLKTAWTEFVEESSRAAEQSGLIGWLTELVETADAFVESRRRGVGMNQIFAEKEGMQRALSDLERFKEFNKEILDDREKNIKAVQDEINLQDKLAASGKLNIMIMKEMLKDEDLSFDRRNSLREQIEQIEFANVKTNQYIDVLTQYQASLKITNKVEEDNTLTLEKLEKMIEDLTEQRRQLNVEDRVGLRVLDSQIAGVQRLIDELNRLGVTSKTSSDGLRKAFEDNPALAELAGQVDSSVDSSLKSGLADIERRGKARLKLIKQTNDAEEKEAARHKRYMEQIRLMTINTAINAAHSVLSAWSESRNTDQNETVEYINNQLRRTDDYYAGLLELTGDNTRRREEVQVQANQKRRELESQLEQAEIAAEERSRIRERNARLRQIAIDTAAGIVRALTIRPGLPEGGPIALFLAAEGLAQAAIVRKFKKGVINLDGEGTETSDSIPARLSKHESVMTAAETKSSMNILKNIRAKKLDDRIFEKLIVNSPAMRPTDLSPVVNELQKNRPRDIIRDGVQLYEVMEERKNLKKKIRNASGFR